MRRMVGAAILVAASVMATPSLAAQSAVNPALSQNLDARPQKKGGFHVKPPLLFQPIVRVISP